MRTLAAFLLLFISLHAGAQPDTAYTNGVNRGVTLYEAGKYQASADAFEQAFSRYGGGYNDERYTAACSWALAGNKNAAFKELNHIAFKGHFTNMDRLLIDDDLETLHADKRWKKLLAKVRKNAAK